MSKSTLANSTSYDKATLETRHRGLLMVAVVGVSIIQFLDLTIANVALPHMQSSLGASLDTIAWVLTSFIIAGVIVTPAIGWVSDTFGSRKVFLWAVGGFIISSMLCGVATSLAQMILFRSLQGICAAFIGPMSQTIMFDINPPSKQPTAIAVWGAISMIAPICGPIVGGVLCDTLNWRWVFYINLPIGIPTLLILLWLLPGRPIGQRKLDKFGFLFLAVSLGALQLMLDRGQSRDWFDSVEITVELVIALAAFWVFLIHTLGTRNPLFPAGLLKNPNYLAAFFFMFVLGMANVAIASVLPTMYQNVYGYSAMDTGFLLMPRGIGVLLTMMVATKLMGKIDVRYLVSAGFMVAALALWMMSTWTLELGRLPILTANFVQGLGLGLIFMPMNVAAFSTLDPQYRPDGSSLINLMRNIGGSFGISGIVTMIARNTQTSHADIATNVTSFTIPSLDPINFTERFGDYGAMMMQMIDLEVNRQALMIAYLDNFYAISFFILAVALSTFLLKPIHVGSENPPVEPPPH